MDIVVLAGGLSTERDVSFKTGDMVAKALRENGHRVILLDVFMGYKEAEEDISDIFEHSIEASVSVSAIPETAPDLAKVRHQERSVSMLFWTKCDFHVPDGRYCIYGITWRKRRERKDSGSF